MGNRPIITLKKAKKPDKELLLGRKATALLEAIKLKYGGQDTFTCSMWNLLALIPKELWSPKFEKLQVKRLWFDATIVNFEKLGILKKIKEGKKGKYGSTYEWMKTK